MTDPTLRTDLTEHHTAHPGDGYPPDLRRRAARHAHTRRSTGAPWQHIADELGVSTTSLRHWCAETAPPAAFVPVVVAQDAPVATTTSYTLVSPRGFRVDGLDLHQLTALLGQLG